MAARSCGVTSSGCAQTKRAVCCSGKESDSPRLQGVTSRDARMPVLTPCVSSTGSSRTAAACSIIARLPRLCSCHSHAASAASSTPMPLLRKTIITTPESAIRSAVPGRRPSASSPSRHSRASSHSSSTTA